MKTSTLHVPPVMALLLAVILSGCSGEREPLPPASDFWFPVTAGGDTLGPDATGDHHCVLDERTGLMWEVKRPEQGLHRASATWTWYQPDPSKNMSDAGIAGGGNCDIERCDTHAWVEAVNQAGLCAHHDWVLPTREQLLTLGDRRLADTGLIMDRDFFPHDPVGEYWSASTFRLYPQSAWVVDNRHGLDRAELKTEPRHARLVRVHQIPEHNSTPQSFRARSPGPLSGSKQKKPLKRKDTRGRSPSKGFCLRQSAP